MDFTTLLIALVVFALIYQGVGLYFETRQTKASAWSQQPNVTSSTLKDLVDKVSQTGLNKALLRNKKFRDRLDLLLIRSGYIFGWKSEDLLFYKELGICLGLFFIWRSGQTQ